jgi:class 3 adenylate cyclase/tetratricopeptide (TPR) repeat protein
VLVCDLVGFTARSDQADPEDVQATLTPYHTRARVEIERLGGTVEKFIGDAVVGVFGVPVVHEDDAVRAVQAALRICEAIAELNQHNPEFDLAVRVAVNTGEAVVALGARPGAGDHFVAGDVVNTAARLQGVAPVGAVVAGEATYRATKELIEYETLPPVRVKGKAQPLAIWRAWSPRRHRAEVEQRPPTPFIGRQHELELLKDLYARCLRERTVGLVTITGAPGVGKSRLVREFRGLTGSDDDLVAWRYGRCLPYGEGVTFWALGEAVKADLGILESDTTKAATAKLEAAIRPLEEDPADRKWLKARLAPLVGLTDPEAAATVKRHEAFTAWQRFLEARAANGPLVIVLEDLHWADEALLAFVQHLVESATEVPMVLIATGRPELCDRGPAWCTDKQAATTISLSPLSDKETAQLVSSLLATSLLPPKLETLLLERAGGNPFYAEQLVRLLLDQSLAEPSSGAIRAGPDATIPMPDSVTAMIAARLDTLRPERKALLQDASVVGQVFSAGALAAVGNIDDRAIRRALRQLLQKDFVQMARGAPGRGQRGYAFSHALIRDVAYGQIPRASRMRKHQAVAAWIEQLAGERVADQAEILAYHYGQALTLARATRATDQLPGLELAARRFSVLAGDRAIGLDVARAEAYYRAALQEAPPDYPQRAGVVAKLARAAFLAGRLAEARQTYQELIEDLQRQTNRLAAGDAMARLGRVLWIQGETQAATRERLQAVQLLEAEPPGPGLANAYAELAFDQIMAGHPQEALQWAQNALAVATALDLGEEKSRALDGQGIARVMLGDQAGLDDLQAALKLARALGLGDQTGISFANLASASWPTAGPAVALEHYRAGIDFAQRRGMIESVTWARCEMLGPLFDLGHWNTLMEVAGQVIASTGASGDRYLPTWAKVEQGRVFLHRGELQRAAQLSEAFLPTAREIGDLQVLVPALSVAARIKQHTGDLSAAQRLVEEFDHATSGHDSWDRANYLPEFIRVCVAAGHHPLGQHLLNTTNATAIRHRHGLVTGRAILAEGQQDLQAAVRLYREAVKGWTTYGHILEKGQALLGVGRCMAQLASRGAVRNLHDARTVFAELTAGPLLAETDTWLRQPSPHSSSSPA